MPFRNLEAVFFCDELPTVEVRDGVFHVTYVISESTRIEIVLPPRVFFAGMSNARNIQREFEGRHCAIHTIDPQTKFERVFPADKSA